MLEYIQIDDVSKKSSEASVSYRSEGNKLYNNQKHNKKVHLEILSLYNQSVAYAENNSEELALAINNRSALLMHLQMYKEALNDIKKSDQITKSDKLRIKLITRKMKDKKTNDDTQEYEAPTIHKVSKTIPCAADCVTIKYDQNYGRYLVATKDIKPGAIILIEQGLVLPKREKTYTNCSHCLMLACNGVPCNSCSALIYCSEKCRDEAWLLYHDLECLVLTYLRYIDASSGNLTHVIIAVRLFIKFIKKERLQNILSKSEKIRRDKSKDEFLNNFYENGIFQSDKFQSFYNLHQDVNDTVYKETISYQYAIIKKIINYLAKKTEIFKNCNVVLRDDKETLLNCTIRILFDLNLIARLNSSNFGESVCYCGHSESCKFACGDQNIGAFIAPFSSLINHSCNQNTCSLFTEKKEMAVFALKFIKKGEQIFTNYGTQPVMPKNSRQNILMRDYNFTCECELCKSNLFLDFSILKDHTQIANLTALLKDVNIKSLEIFYKPEHDFSFDQTTIKDVIKMCQIIDKSHKSTFAFTLLVKIKHYICLYFDKLYNVKIFNVPNSC